MNIRCESCNSEHIKGGGNPGFTSCICQDCGHKWTFKLDRGTAVCAWVSDMGTISRPRVWFNMPPYYFNKKWSDRTFIEKLLFWKRFTKEVTGEEFFLAIYEQEIEAFNANVDVVQS